MIECMRNAAREHMTLDEQISFCEEKSKNIKLKAEPQTFVDIKNSLEKLKNPWIPVSERLPEEMELVLIYAESTARGGSIRVVAQLDNGFWFTQTSSDTLGLTGIGQYNVIAWQPLPAPFRDKE